MNLKTGTQISEQLSQSLCTQTAITNDETIKERWQKKEHFVHGSSQYIHIGITINDASKQKIEKPDTKRHNTEGRKIFESLELS